MTLRRRAALALASGGVLALGAPPLSWWPVVFVSLALLATAWDGARPREAFVLGWIAGTAATLGAFYWIVGTVTRFTPLPTIAAVLAYALLSAAAGLTLACAGLLASGATRVIGFPASAALAVVVVERYAPSVFPWQLASPLISAPWIRQGADVLGVSGLGAVLLAVLAVGVGAVSRAGTHPGPARPGALQVAVAGTVFIALWVYGGVRTGQVERETARAPALHVALVQPAIPPTVRWDEQNFGDITRTLHEQAWAGMRDHADLVVWSEGAFPYPLPMRAGHDGDGAERIFPWPATAPILVGAVVLDDRGQRFNGALIREADGRRGMPVAKRVLVPFGEYVPIVAQIAWVRRNFARVEGLTPGERPTMLTTASGVRLGVLNCFEDTLGYVAADLASADLLVNITNDAWFGDGAAPWQHLMLARWRSIETRREMVRAVNTGVTGRVDALGRVVAHAAVGRRATLMVDARRLSMRPVAPYVIRFAPPAAALLLALAIGEGMRRARGERA
ncbi:MAG: apolipoprotein N-acyltransferase [Deltaproteobacteria bacterium]